MHLSIPGIPNDPFLTTTKNRQNPYFITNKVYWQTQTKISIPAAYKVARLPRSIAKRDVALAGIDLDVKMSETSNPLIYMNSEVSLVPSIVEPKDYDKLSNVDR